MSNEDKQLLLEAIEFYAQRQYKITKADQGKYSRKEKCAASIKLENLQRLAESF